MLDILLSFIHFLTSVNYVFHLIFLFNVIAKYSEIKIKKHIKTINIDFIKISTETPIKIET